MAKSLSVLACVSLFAAASASDLLGATEVTLQGMAASTDEARALDVKNAEFWQPLEEAAAAAKQADPHKALIEEAEAALAKLPAEDTYVHDALAEAVENLKLADGDLAAQAGDSADAAAEHLAHNRQDVSLGEAQSGSVGFVSWLVGEDSPLSQMVRRLSGAGFQRALHEDVEERQQAILPSLRGALRGTRSSAGVLHESHVASSRSFDILKYNIYNRSTPKTPKEVTAIANKIVDAAGSTRHRFMELTLRSVGGIKHDVETEGEDAQATVVRSVGGDEGFLAKQPADEPEKRSEGLGPSDTTCLLLPLAALVAGGIFGQLWTMSHRHLVGGVFMSPESRRAGQAFALFIIVIVGALLLDLFGLLHRAAFAAALCFGALGLGGRSIASRYVAQMEVKKV